MTPEISELILAAEPPPRFRTRSSASLPPAPISYRPSHYRLQYPKILNHTQYPPNPSTRISTKITTANDKFAVLPIAYVHRALAHFDTALIAETTVNELIDHIHEHVTKMLLGKEAYRPLPPAITGKIALCASVVDDAHTMNSKHLSTADLNSRSYYTFKEFRNTSVHPPYSISVPMMSAIMKIITNPRFLGTFAIARQIIKDQAELTLRLYGNTLRADFAHAVGKGIEIDISPTRDGYKLSVLNNMKVDAAWVHRYVGAEIQKHFAYMGIDIGDICGPTGGDPVENVMTGEEGVARGEGTGGGAKSGEDVVGEARKGGDARGDEATEGSAGRAVKGEANPMSASQRKKQRRKEVKADKDARDAYFNKTIEEANKRNIGGR